MAINGCFGKRQFKNRHQARKMLSRFGNRPEINTATGDVVKMGIYRCTACNYYHLGHKYFDVATK